MADQGKWFKLHCGWDDDPSIDALSDADQLRWVKLGTYMKEHGTNGEITLFPPARALQHKFRVNSFQEVIDVLKRLPNICVEEKQNSSVSYETVVTVSFKNWHRYQPDFSTYRVRKYRLNETAKKRREEKRRDVEEKRQQHIAPSGAKQESASPFTDNGKLVGHYKAKQGVLPEDKEWDRKFWGRSAKAAKEILDAIGGLNDAISFFDHHVSKLQDQGLEWTIETIAKRAILWKAKQRRKNEVTYRQGVSVPEIINPRNQRDQTSRGPTAAGAILAPVRNLEVVEETERDAVAGDSGASG